MLERLISIGIMKLTFGLKQNIHKIESQNTKHVHTVTAVVNAAR